MAPYLGPRTINARLYLNETTEVLLTETMASLRRFGICHRFFTHNGPGQATARQKQVCQSQRGL